MSELIGFIILLILLSLLERLLKGAQSGKGSSAPESGAEVEDRGGRAAEELPTRLQDLVAEELGINLERRPKVQAPEKRREAEHPYRAPQEEWREAPSPYRRVPEEREPPRREVVYPTPGSEEPSFTRAEEIAAAESRRRQELLTRSRRETEARRRAETARRKARAMRGRVEAPPSLEEQARRERGEPVSLEEQGMREVHVVSLETPRRPEDHQRFHERYQVPRPVASHAEFHERYVKPPDARVRRRRARLPDRPGWSAIQKAVIWSEVLGPPKAME